MANKKKTTTTTTTTSHGTMDTSRYTELKQLLEDRRRELMSEVHTKIKDVRAEGASGMMHSVAELGESSESGIQEDIELALIQMKAETLNRIDEALARLEAGEYGYCFECGDEIAPQRLRALPFAVRCRDCEEARELAHERERFYAQRRGAGSLFADLAG